MTSSSLQSCVDRLLAVVLAATFAAMPASRAQDKPDADKIPKKVMDTLKARFPKAEIHKWTREREGNIVIYDFEFTQGGRKFEADVREDGVIHNWEAEIAVRDLPGAVRKAVERKYPKAVLKEAMAITAVTGGKEELEGYEIVVKTADGKETEVSVAPDGKILEDSGEEK